MGKCLTCQHPEREAIDRALVAGEPLRRLGARYGVSKSSLGDHKSNHLAESLRAAAVRAGEEREDGLFGELRELSREAKRILREARRSKDHPAALAAIAQLFRHLELLTKLRPQTGLIGEGPPVSRVRINVGRLGITSEVVKAPEFEIVFGPLGPKSQPVIAVAEVKALPEARLSPAPEAVRDKPEPLPKPASAPARPQAEPPQRSGRHWMEARVREAAEEDSENEDARRGIGRAKYSGF